VGSCENSGWHFLDQCSHSYRLLHRVRMYLLIRWFGELFSSRIEAPSQERTHMPRNTEWMIMVVYLVAVAWLVASGFFAFQVTSRLLHFLA